MTVSSTTARNEYNGNGATTVFAYTFRILDEDHIAVYVDGTLQTITTDYTVSGVGVSGGGNITFVAAPASGTANVIFLRNVPLTQETDYVENDPFPAESHEDALDKLTMIVQQQQEQIDRTLQLPVTGTFSNVSVPDPSAGKALLWNQTEDALINSTDNFNDIVTNAAASASTATTQAGIATTEAGLAETARLAAEAAQTAAEAAQTNAETAETNAETAEANAEAAASAVGTQFAFDAGTSMADPGTGDFRFNNASAGATTAIAVSALTSEAGNADVSAFIATWAGSTNTIKGYITLKKSAAPATFAVFSVSSVTDNGTWLELGVTHVASNGTWTAADVAYMAFARTGDKGVDGAGAGDVSGPASATDGNFAAFDGTTGKLIKQATNASQGEMEAGTEAGLRAMSPLRVAQAIAALASGGATGAGGDRVFWENDQTVDNDYTITSGKNAVSAGPITISTGVTVTVPSGSTWTVV